MSFSRPTHVALSDMYLVTLTMDLHNYYDSQWRTQEIFFGRGGGQQIQLRTEDRENGDLGTVAP
jgi:hypothetical protein